MSAPLVPPGQPKVAAHLFSQAALDKVVRDALPTDAKPGEHVIVGSVTSDGAQVVMSLKKSDKPGLNWELQAAANHNWQTGDNSVGAKVILRW